MAAPLGFIGVQVRGLPPVSGDSTSLMTPAAFQIESSGQAEAAMIRLRSHFRASRSISGHKDV
jgi:hypothetical protein